jgi:hypothetical protein
MQFLPSRTTSFVFGSVLKPCNVRVILLEELIKAKLANTLKAIPTKSLGI